MTGHDKRVERDRDSLCAAVLKSSYAHNTATRIPISVHTETELLPLSPIPDGLSYIHIQFATMNKSIVQSLLCYYVCSCNVEF